MNKKMVTMAVSLAVGGSLLLSTGFANAAQMSGYEAYKSAIVNTKNLKSETADMNVTVKDGEANLVNLSSKVKLNLNTNAMSSVTTTTKGATSQSSNIYLQDGKSISKDSNSADYFVKTNNLNASNKMDKAQNPTVEKSMEVVVDTLVGNMKDSVNIKSNTDGTKNINIDLKEKEVTPLVNALTQIAFIQGTKNISDSSKADLGGVKNVLPQLQSDINVKSVSSTGKISKDGIITSQTAKIVISGKDAQGNKHEITFNLDLNLSNINSTTPNKVDLTKVQVKQATSYQRH